MPPKPLVQLHDSVDLSQFPCPPQIGSSTFLLQYGTAQSSPWKPRLQSHAFLVALHDPCALHLASFRGHLDVVKHLVDDGYANKYLLDNNGESPLTSAVRGCRPKVLAPF